MLAHLTNLALLVGVVGGILGYLVLQVKDFRPVRQLRQENHELRTQYDDLSQKFDDLKRHYDELEHRYVALEKSRDFQASFDLSIRAIDEARASAATEHAGLMTALEKHGEEELKAWMALQREMAANTAVLSTMAAGIYAGALAASAPAPPRRRRSA